MFFLENMSLRTTNLRTKKHIYTTAGGTPVLLALQAFATADRISGGGGLATEAAEQCK